MPDADSKPFDADDVAEFSIIEKKELVKIATILNEREGSNRCMKEECGAPEKSDARTEIKNTSTVRVLVNLADDTTLRPAEGKGCSGPPLARYAFSGCNSLRMNSSACCATAITFPRSSRLNVLAYTRFPSESLYEREKLTL